MTQETLLSGEDNTPQADPTKNYLEELVGEGKKFKTVEDLARGKYEADLYVKTLENRSDELRTDYLGLRKDYESRAKLEELIDQLSKQQLTSNEQPEVKEVNNEKPVFDPKDIESLVSSEIRKHEVTKKQQDNFDIVRNKLKERWGNNYQNVLKEQVETLGLTDDDVNALARKSPNAFFKTMGLDREERQDTFQSPIKSSQRSDNFSPNVPKRTWAYYQKMKKDNPTLYSSPKITNQMHADAIALGKDFEDGDFKVFD